MCGSMTRRIQLNAWSSIFRKWCWRTTLATGQTLTSPIFLFCMRRFLKKWNLGHLPIATTNGSLINTGGYNWTIELLEMLDLNSKVVPGVVSHTTRIPMIYQWRIPLRKVLSWCCMQILFPFRRLSSLYVCSCFWSKVMPVCHPSDSLYTMVYLVQ